MANEAVQTAKEKWILRVASEGEKAVKDGRMRWNCIRKLQLAHAGWRSIKPSAVMKEDGVPTADLDEENCCWHRHFTKLLNITSRFQEEIVTGIPPQPVC